MDSLEHIVIGIDFSECSRHALASAIRIARANNATLHAVHITESLVVADLNEALKIPAEEIGTDACKAATRRMAAMIEKEEPGDVVVEATSVVGTPFAELLHAVDRTNADLLIVGASGRSKHDRPVAGRLAARCIRKAATKVLLVRRYQDTPFQRVVACIDFSDMTPLVIEQAVRVAQQNKSRLDILHVFDPPWRHLHYRAPTPTTSADFRDEYRQVLQDRLVQATEPYADDLDGITVERHLIESTDPAYRITQFAANSECDLVVVGTRGRTGLRTLLLGTTAEEVIRESRSSVLAIKPADFSYKL